MAEVAAADARRPGNVRERGVRRRRAIEPGHVVLGEFAERGVVPARQREDPGGPLADGPLRQFEISEGFRQRNRDATGDAGRPCRLGVGCGPVALVALEDDVCVRARHSVRAHPGQARVARPIRPRGGLRGYPYRQPVPIDRRVRGVEVQVTGDHPVADRQRRLDQAGYAGCRFRVAEVGLRRPDEQRAFGVAPLGVHGRDGRELDRVADRRSRAVRLDIIHRPRRNTGPG